MIPIILTTRILAKIPYPLTINPDTNIINNQVEIPIVASLYFIKQ